MDGWIAGVLRAASPILECGYGLHGWAYTAPPSSHIRLRCRRVQTEGSPAGLVDAAEKLLLALPPPLIDGMCRRVPALAHGIARLEALGAPSIGWQPAPQLHRFGLTDMVGVCGYDANAVGLLVCAPRPSPP